MGQGGGDSRRYDGARRSCGRRDRSGAGAHLVIVKDDIHAPVETVLDPPVLADGMIQSRRVCRQTGNVETILKRRLVLDHALRDDNGKRLEVRPAFGSMPAVDQQSI